MAKEIMTAEQITNRDAWLKQRENGIGGSDAASVLGMNKWKSTWELWAEKTGRVKAPDLSGNEAVYFGTLLEDVVADEFERRTGKKVKRAGLLQDDEYPFMLASVDRLIEGENAGLECKTASGYAARLWDGDEIPDSYYVQCLHYMMITGAERWYIAALIGGQKFIWKTIERNDDDIAALRESEINFWRLVSTDTPPDVDGSESCTRIITDKYQGGGEPIELPADAADIFSELDELTDAADSIKTRIDAAKNRLREMLGDADVGTIGDRKVTWRAQAGKVTVDSKRLKAEAPDVYGKYTKLGAPIRVMRIY